MNISTYYLGMIEFIILIIFIFLPYFGLDMGLKKFFKHIDKNWYLNTPSDWRNKRLETIKVCLTVISVFVLTFFGVLPFLIFVVFV